jgi:hydroxyacylglutathione hydrolase
LAAVCDPIDEPELYLRTAEQSGMKIRYVVDTHIHADHISGGRRLAGTTGARYVLHASCGSGYEFFPVEDGWRFGTNRTGLECRAGGHDLCLKRSRN